ncbi:MAG: NlpC/P60 family protein, partial [Flavobacterium sp.]
NYEGWVQANQLFLVGEEEALTTTHYTNGFASLVAMKNSHLHVPFGTAVFNPENLRFSVGGQEFQYLMQPQQCWNQMNMMNETTLKAVYQPYINTPYLWGGKSVYGTDCSGFVQQVFKFFGKKLLRDAYLQAEQGEPVSSIDTATNGDLAFFQNEKGKVTHVGIVLADQKIVHASGHVKIDSIDRLGIVNNESGLRTHVLYSIRRLN